MALPTINVHIVTDYSAYDENLSPHKNCKTCKNTKKAVKWMSSPTTLTAATRKHWRAMKMRTLSKTKRKPQVVERRLAPPIKMEIPTSEVYRGTGPLIYEDPNVLGPKDWYILVRVNMFDKHGVHPEVMWAFINEALKQQDNRRLLKDINNRYEWKMNRRSPRITVQQYIDSMNAMIVKMSRTARMRSRSNERSLE